MFPGPRGAGAGGLGAGAAETVGASSGAAGCCCSVLTSGVLVFSGSLTF
jgi:hypothetical protein